MSRQLVLLLIVMAAVAYCHAASISLAQTDPTGQQRIAEPIVVNGEQAQGVLVIQDGTVQGYTCPSPQPYVTANQSESGWACFEQTTGVWLLHAQPPLQATTPQQAPIIAYQQPPVYVPAPTIPIYSSYPYGYYPYAYYPYSYYPYIVGPRFGVGFGFGYRSPIFVNRPVVINRPVVPFVASRPFGGFRHAGVAFGRIGRR